MELSFKQSFLSITSFPDIVLPDFTLITGLNGAGKSHLLSALYNGSIITDRAPNQSPQNNDQVRLFDWNTLIPQDTGYFASETIKNERLNLYQQVDGLRRSNQPIELIRAVARRYNVQKELVADPALLLGMSPDERRRSIGPKFSANAERELIDAATRAENQILNHIGAEIRPELRSLAQLAGKPIMFLTERDITDPLTPSWGTTSLFQQSFARLFVAYRDVFLANQLAQLRSSKGSKDAPFLAPDAFVQNHGVAPWDFVNQSLASAGLGFTINRPDLDSYSSYQPQLTKTKSGSLIPFANLSSGEKVLMSFAFCLYYASDRRQLTVFPKLILLDEVDAPLHPVMSRNLIETITRVLVGEFGINVIATTHSPSTLALAPESSIYLMRPEGEGLKKITKPEGLNILTVGVPTLSVEFSGRRQVFVESPADAETYSLLAEIFKNRSTHERSLEFISTGAKSSHGSDVDTGSSNVKRLVNAMADAGNMSVFGLVDWDGKNDPSERIAVLAHGRRNGLENLLLDPLLVGALLCRDFPFEKSRIGLVASTSWLDFCGMTPSKMQDVSTRIASLVLGSAASKQRDVNYAGGMTLSIDERYLTLDDHKIEGQVLAAFPCLNKEARAKGGSAGKLMQHIARTVLTDMPDLMPKELIDLFNELLTRPSHA